jgi:PAP2 superfamily/TAT (twin-arginine translocation) pathway signal sequence
MSTKDTSERGDALSRRHFLTGAAAAAAAVVVPAVGTAPAVAGTDRPAPEHFDARVATTWLDLTRTLIRTTPGYTPPVAARALGYIGLTLYEAVVPGSRRYRSLRRVLPNPPDLPHGRAELHWPAVANAALADIARFLFPTTADANKAAIAELESSLVEQFAHEVHPRLLARSIQRGRTVAQRIFEWSTGDGGHEGYLRNFPPNYAPPVGPGLWVPTPPGFQPALQPFWGANRCTVLTSGAACPPGDHTPYSADPSSTFHAEAMEVYDAVNHLTPEQRAIAVFWSDDPGITATPPGHSFSIATQVLRAERVSLMTAAETYLKVGLAVSDAFVACWNAKYRYNLLRPVSYIRERINPGWLPILNTPPFPEYPSGHSVQSGAAFTVLANLLGHAYTFVDHTHDERGLPARQFRSFGHAAQEAALSRLYGGIHFRPATELGLVQGECIGQAVGALPVRSPQH